MPGFRPTSSVAGVRGAIDVAAALAVLHVAGEHARASAPCPARPSRRGSPTRIVRAGRARLRRERQLHGLAPEQRGRRRAVRRQRDVDRGRGDLAARLARLRRRAGSTRRRRPARARASRRRRRTSGSCRAPLSACRPPALDLRRRDARVLAQLDASRSASRPALRCITRGLGLDDLAAAQHPHAALEAQVLVAAREGRGARRDVRRRRRRRAPARCGRRPGRGSSGRRGVLS